MQPDDSLQRRFARNPLFATRRIAGEVMLVPARDLFECGGGSRMYMYQRAEPTKAEHTVAMFEVEDVERAVDDLSANGVTFEQYDLPGLQTNEKGIVEMEGERTAWFKDPEGNIVALGQMVERGREAGR